MIWLSIDEIPRDFYGYAWMISEAWKDNGWTLPTMCRIWFESGSLTGWNLHFDDTLNRMGEQKFMLIEKPEAYK